MLGGNGGVGCFAIQLLKYWGAHVTTTCSSKSIDWLQSFTSVDECFDYQDTEQYLQQYPGTFDFILDASSPTASRKNYEIISSLVNRNRSGPSSSSTIFNKKRTMYITLSSPLLRNFDQYGMVSGTMTTLSDAILDTLNGIQRGVSFRWAYYLPNNKALAYIAELVERSAIKPFTTNVFDFDNAIDAYESMEQRPVNGKVVLQYQN